MAEGVKNSCKDQKKSLARMSEGFSYIDQQNIEFQYSLKGLYEMIEISRSYLDFGPLFGSL